MASIFAILSSKGKQLLHRNYRQDCSVTTIDTFVEKVVNEEEVNTRPVFEVAGNSYAWVQHNSLYFVLISKTNCNASMLTVFLHSLITTLKEYTEHITEESIRDNFVVLYELLDETMDFGYPQQTDAKVLKEYIIQESHRLTLLSDNEKPKALPSSASGAAGATPWRPAGISYTKNEAFLDVIDKHVLLINTNGDILNSEILGVVQMRSKLTGMPQLQLELNNKALMGRDEDFSGGGSSPKGSCDLDDIKFHQCVNVNKYDQTRSITFIPPDGEFDLITYRMSQKVKPIISVDSEVNYHGGSRLELMIKAKSQFSRIATNVVLTIPVPPDADSPNMKCTAGTVKYLPDKDVLEWTIKVCKNEVQKRPKSDNLTSHNVT